LLAASEVGASVGFVRSQVGKVLRKTGVLKSAPEGVPFNALDSYASSAPSAQLAIDVFPGEWSSALPAELDVRAGHAQLFEDPRIERAIEWLGGDVKGAKVLELGPLEGGHTYMFERAGADVLAIESNSRAFLKCLVVKELLSLQRARFLRGDFVEYLRSTPEKLDVAVASGVLYHMVNPLELLTLLADASDRLVIWTHYFDKNFVMSSIMARQFKAAPEPHQFQDASYSLHPRDYLEASKWSGFCGGPETFARWMERDDILDMLRRLGFADVEIAHDVPNHPNGPCFMVLARRSAVS